LIRESWGHVTGQFDLDHFIPQIQAPEQPASYDNLVYACHACNLRKHAQRLSDSALTCEHVRVYEDGRIVGLTPEAERAIRVLWLNTPQTIQWRRLWIRIVQLAEVHDDDLVWRLMGYPDDLPDLSLLFPPWNSKPEESSRAVMPNGGAPNSRKRTFADTKLVKGWIGDANLDCEFNKWTAAIAHFSGVRIVESGQFATRRWWRSAPHRDKLGRWRSRVSWGERRNATLVAISAPPRQARAVAIAAGHIRGPGIGSRSVEAR
jgi:hypothetical protein